MKNNFKTIVQPYCIPNRSLIKNDITDIITPFTNIKQLENIPQHIMQQLMALFFDPNRNMELNLSTNLNPEYFKNPGKNKLYSNNMRLRNLYLDILRYDYWEEK